MTCPTCGCGHNPALRRETEDGPERYCRRCDEWWPDDAEFWYSFGKPKQRCKACQDERTRLWSESLPIDVRRAKWREQWHRRHAA